MTKNLKPHIVTNVQTQIAAMTQGQGQACVCHAGCARIPSLLVNWTGRWNEPLGAAYDRAAVLD